VTKTLYKLAWPDGQLTIVTIETDHTKKPKIMVAGVGRAKFDSLYDYSTREAIEAQLRVIMQAQDLKQVP